jgi:hypothetical protein
VRTATTLAALVAAAACAAPASAATDWRTAGNEICTDFYDELAIYSGEHESDAGPGLLTGLARLTERKDARLARLRPPPPSAQAFETMLGHDRRSARTLRELARGLERGDGSAKLLRRYESDTRAFVRLARRLRLTACAGGGDAVTGPAVEL